MRRTLTVLAAAAAVCGLLAFVVPPASAQVEPGGWTAYTPSYNVQRVGCAKISGMTFSLTCSSGRGEQRAEFRYQSYSSGSHQFEGYVKLVSFGGDRINLKQTFKTTGPFFLLAIDHGGRLYSVHDGKVLATGVIVGTTVRVNTVHVVGQVLRVYINGSLVYSIRSPSGTFYDKIGAYRNGSGHGPITVTWSNVQFWRK